MNKFLLDGSSYVVVLTHALNSHLVYWVCFIPLFPRTPNAYWMMTLLPAEDTSTVKKARASNARIRGRNETSQPTATQGKQARSSVRMNICLVRYQARLPEGRRAGKNLSVYCSL